ncbi:MAG: hypothetical protein WB609_01145 [Candidatus Cybelea sp.]
MIQIQVLNDDTDDALVTMVDNNTSPANTVLNNQRINGGQNVANIAIQEDGSGNGNVSWTSTSIDGTASNTGTATPSYNETVAVSTYRAE